MKLIYKCLAIAAVIPSLLLSGCAKENSPYRGEERSVLLQMNVGTRAVDELDGTPDPAESAINTLRVYAFVDGELAGHFYSADASSLDPGDSGGRRFLMDLKMYSLGSRNVDFYVVANEKAMVTAGGSRELTDRTTQSELDSFTFTGLDISGGLPMCCRQTETIDFDSDAQDNPQTVPGHEGHTLLDRKLSFTLSRPVGKLGVFAAKPQGESGRLYITGISMTRARFVNYLMPQDDPDVFGTVGSPASRELSFIADEIQSGLPETADRTDAGNYTPVLDEAYYPFENPWGSGTWDAPGDARGNILTLRYRFDGEEERTGTVYMPPVVRNSYYKVCCLINNSGKITVEYTVADWDDEDVYTLDFAYPTYVNPLMPPGGVIPTYPPTIYYNSDPDSAEGAFEVNFNISAPVGQEWQPTLLNATQGDYEVTVWQGGQKMSPPYYPSPDDYTIRIRALKPDNVGKKIDFAIAYVPKWDPSESSMLLINGQQNDTKWPGSDDPQIIVVEQIDHV